ncbi:MAG: hypothetical protein KC457_13530 [Myxococcales bacterium]|nr:hypothetical protein [Myxococcales bacterium]
MLARLRAHPGVRLLADHVTALSDAPTGAVAHTETERIAARWIFDSRLDPRALHQSPGRVLLWQHFHGLRLRIDDGPAFDPACPIYMDLRAHDPEALAFLHVLSEGPAQALIYRIEIGPHARVHARELDDDLQNILGLRRWQVLDHERGILPMTDQRFARRVGPSTLRIGNAGGRLKASSGYALTRILADNRAIAASLARRGHPFDLPREHASLRLLDGVLLEIIGRDPPLGAALLAGLFARCDAPTILRFLDEEVGLREILRIMMAMPHKPLLAWTGLRRALAWLRRPRAMALPASRPAQIRQ